MNSNTQVISCIYDVKIKDVKSRDTDTIQAYTLFCSAENIYRISNFGINYLQCIGTKWDKNRSEYTIANEAINLGDHSSQPNYFNDYLRIEEKDFFQYDRIYIIYQLAETANGSWSYYLSKPDNYVNKSIQAEDSNLSENPEEPQSED